MQFKQGHKFTWAQKKAFVRFKRAMEASEHKYGLIGDHVDWSSGKPVDDVVVIGTQSIT